MKCRAFRKWNLILMITLLTVQTAGYLTEKPVYAQTDDGLAGIAAEEQEMVTDTDSISDMSSELSDSDSEEDAGMETEEQESLTGTGTIFGEASDLTGCYYVKDFMENIPENDGITNLCINDERAVVSFIKDGSIGAYEYRFSDQAARVIEFPVPVDEQALLNAAWEGMSCGIFPASDGGFFYQFNKDLKCFDREGELVREFELETEFPGVYESVAAECTDDMLYLYYPDGTEQSYNLPDHHDMMPAGVYEDTVMLKGFDRYRNFMYMDVDLATGEIRESGIVSQTSEKLTPCLYGAKLSDTQLLAANFRSDSCGFIYDITTNMFPVMPYGDGFFAAGYRYGSNGGRTTTIASFAVYRSGQRTPVFTGEVSGLFGLNFDKAAVYGDCLVFFPYASVNEPDLLIMELGGCEEAGEEAPEQQLNPGSGVEKIGNSGSYETKLYPSATEVNTDYCSKGIGFYMGEDIYPCPFSDSRDIEVCEDQERINAFRQDILNYMAMLPEGFLDEVILPYEGFDIYLTGGLVNRVEGALDAAGATNEYGSRLCITFDLNQSAAPSLIRHEFFHAYEFAMNRIAGKEVFSEWDELNPPGFIYKDYAPGLIDDQGPDNNDEPNLYTPSSKQASDPETIWFERDYGKTNPQEDRAVIVESVGPTWGAYMHHNYFTSSHIQAKMREISRQMRTHFKTLENADVLPWELAISDTEPRIDLTYSRLSTKYKEYEYTGNYRQPKLTVLVGAEELTKDVDYTVTYSDNRNVGTATITATGIGKYSGSNSVTFELVKADLGKATLSTKYKEYEYTGNNRQPNLTVKVGSKVLTRDVDYTVRYSDNKNVGTGTITATGIGNYKGTNSVTFKLVKADLGKATLSTKYREYEYTGNNRQPNLTVKVGTKVLTRDVDYTVRYSNNKNVGTGTITATGIGNYKGTNSVTFKLVKADLGKATLSTKYKEYEYTGNNRQPNVTVKIGSKVLKKDVDYTVTYSNNKNVGTAKITVTGIGNYKGTGSTTFKIIKKK